MKSIDDRRLSRIIEVQLAKMAVSSRAQRELREGHVEHLLANFEPDHFGYPVVNLRDGRYYIVDGQHRIEALKRWLSGWESQQIPCRVYEGMTEAEEAQMFDRLSDVRQINAFDKFRVRITAGRAEETKIAFILEKEGLSIGRARASGQIGAVNSLRSIYINFGADTLAKTLRTLRDAYGDSGYEARVLSGVAKVFSRYNGSLDERQVMVRLRDMHGGIKGLLGKAQQLQKQTSNALNICVAAAVVDAVRTGRGGAKIPTWWKKTGDLT